MISVPNFFHHSNMSSILNGRFCYEDWGVMDYTHLRFYALEDIQELMIASGFEIKAESLSYAMDEYGRMFYRRFLEEGPYEINERAGIWKIDSVEKAISYATYQFIFTARLL